MLRPILAEDSRSLQHGRLPASLHAAEPQGSNKAQNTVNMLRAKSRYCCCASTPQAAKPQWLNKAKHITPSPVEGQVQVLQLGVYCKLRQGPRQPVAADIQELYVGWCGWQAAGEAVT